MWEFEKFPHLKNLKNWVVWDVAKKKRENVGILKKQGGGLPESHIHFFTVFNMGDPQK